MINVAYIRRDGCTGSTQFMHTTDVNIAFGWLETKVAEALMPGYIGAPLIVAVIHEHEANRARRYFVGRDGRISFDPEVL